MDLSKEMMASTIQKMWEDFEDKVVPEDADIVQRSEMRMTFVSGMTVGLSKYLNIHQLGKQNFIDALAAQSEAYCQEQAQVIYKKEKRHGL